MAQELKAHCITTRSYNTCFCYDKPEVDAVLTEKDAENRRLKRALWLARARRASAWQIHFALSHNHSIKREFTINGASSPHDRMVTMRTAKDWAMIWKNVERKCRDKAEQYKYEADL